MDEAIDSCEFYIVWTRAMIFWRVDGGVLLAPSVYEEIPCPTCKEDSVAKNFSPNKRSTPMRKIGELGH